MSTGISGVSTAVSADYAVEQTSAGAARAPRSAAGKNQVSELPHVQEAGLKEITSNPREIFSLIRELFTMLLGYLEKALPSAGETPPSSAAAKAGEPSVKPDAAKPAAEEKTAGSRSDAAEKNTASSSSKASSAAASTTEKTPASSKSSAAAGKSKDSAKSSASSSQNSSAESTAKGKTGLQALTSDAGKPVVLTEDGYRVQCEGKDQTWTITAPSGKTTKIWGDPHVVESDGDSWDFRQRTTFVFGSNKVTVETAPLENGTALTGAITVYSGNERVTIADIDKDRPHITAAADDGKTHDAGLDDGTIYKLSKEAKTGDDEWEEHKAA